MEGDISYPKGDHIPEIIVNSYLSCKVFFVIKRGDVLSQEYNFLLFDKKTRTVETEMITKMQILGGPGSAARELWLFEGLLKTCQHQKVRC